MGWKRIGPMRRPAAGGEAPRAGFFRPLLQEKNSLTVSSLFPYNENRIPVEGWLYVEQQKRKRVYFIRNESGAGQDFRGKEYGCII